jgi:hypothetical protein
MLSVPRLIKGEIGNCPLDVDSKSALSFAGENVEPMRRILHIVAAALAVMMGRCLAQSTLMSNMPSLCDLQKNLVQGERRNVRVEGVYLSGLEGQYLVTADCWGRSTDIEFELKTHHLWKRLVALTNRTNTKRGVSGNGDPVLVTFEGEAYGPPVPDPKLPDAIRKNYHPGWDSMNTSMTKMVVQEILSVKPLPANHPCAPHSTSQPWPCLQSPAPVSQVEIGTGHTSVIKN